MKLPLRLACVLLMIRSVLLTPSIIGAMERPDKSLNGLPLEVNVIFAIVVEIAEVTVNTDSVPSYTAGERVPTHSIAATKKKDRKLVCEFMRVKK